ncbi:MAG: ThiF family adenylyltransferase [Planctomycetaceae bacterium]
MNQDRHTRYDRQVCLSMIGSEGQERLARSRIAVLGCGALGTVAADILARAGVGYLRLIDRDVVEWTNLQRQSLYTERDALQGRAKADAACEAISLINSEIECEPWVTDLSPDNIGASLEGCDLVIDAADNFAVRFLLNDYSLENRLPWVHGGCVGTGGQVAFFSGKGHPCFRCLVPEMPPASAVATCDTAGVLGSATHAIASLQATEAIKWLTGNHAAIRQGVWSIDFWINRNRVISLPPSLSEQCAACSSGRRDFLSGTEAGTAVAVCGRQAVRIAASGSAPADLEAMAHRWRTLPEVSANRFFARCRVSGTETLTLFRDGRALVEGTDDVARARSIYAQFVGG